MNIICFGDSITRGYDVREGLGWIELCSAALPAYHIESRHRWTICARFNQLFRILVYRQVL